MARAGLRVAGDVEREHPPATPDLRRGQPHAARAARWVASRSAASAHDLRVERVDLDRRRTGRGGRDRGAPPRRPRSRSRIIDHSRSESTGRSVTSTPSAAADRAEVAAQRLDVDAARQLDLGDEHVQRAAQPGREVGDVAAGTATIPVTVETMPGRSAPWTESRYVGPSARAGSSCGTSRTETTSGRRADSGPAPARPRRPSAPPRRPASSRSGRAAASSSSPRGCPELREHPVGLGDDARPVVTEDGDGEQRRRRSSGRLARTLPRGRAASRARRPRGGRTAPSVQSAITRTLRLKVGTRLTWYVRCMNHARKPAQLDPVDLRDALVEPEAGDRADVLVAVRRGRLRPRRTATTLSPSTLAWRTACCAFGRAERARAGGEVGHRGAVAGATTRRRRPRPRRSAPAAQPALVVERQVGVRSTGLALTPAVQTSVCGVELGRRRRARRGRRRTTRAGCSSRTSMLALAQLARRCSGPCPRRPRAGSGRSPRRAPSAGRPATGRGSTGSRTRAMSSSSASASTPA